MGEKVLVAYASKCGSTAEVAAEIGRVLGAAGTPVDVRPLSSVGDLSGYRAVALGSAVRAGSWLPEASGFLKSHQSSLAKVPTAVFTVCMTLQDPTPANVEVVRGYVAKALAGAPEVNPVDVGLFAGVVDYKRLNFALGLILKYFIKSPEGDFRDWPAIRDWAEKMRPILAG